MEDTYVETEINQGFNVKYLRKIEGIKIETFAQLLGIPVENAVQLETKTKLDKKTLDNCAKILKVPVEVIEYMPLKETPPLLFFKDVKFVNSSIAGKQNTINNNYNDLGLIDSYKELLEYQKKEINRLSDQIKNIE